MLEGLTPMRRAGFGQLLRQAREGLGITQQEVADELIKLAWKQHHIHVGVDRQMVSKWEREMKLPDATYRELLCILYGASPERLGFGPASRSITERPALLLPTDSLGLESPLDIAERIQEISSTNLGSDTINQLENIIELVVNSYESSGPNALAPRVIRQRKTVQDLLSGRQHPKQRDRLYGVASKMSALLSYMAVNMGKFATASAYAEEAFLLADMIGDFDLQAWIRGTESFCAYYQRDYAKAVELARDGLRYARSGPHTVRLAVNGEARALGKLGDATGVSRAVDVAYQASEKFDSVAGVSSCISFGIYSPARTAANAATAYVSLGRPDKVEEYSRLVTPAMEKSDSVWTQSLVRLDVATAMVLAKRPEPEQAARLVKEALTISADRPVTSVLTRSQEFLDGGTRWSDLPAMKEAAAALKAATKR